MGESSKHMELVSLAYEFIKSKLPLEYHKLIHIDSPDKNRPEKDIDGFIPDVYYCYNKCLYIGEAKTSNDFDKEHSIAQFLSYIKECNMFDGETNIIITVPWDLVNHAKNFFRLKIKDNNRINVIIINELGNSYKV